MASTLARAAVTVIAAASLLGGTAVSAQAAPGGSLSVTRWKQSPKPPVAKPAPKPVVKPQAGPVNPRLATWERIAKCESGGRWNINTGNGYYGGLQFNLRTWRAYGGKGYPHQNTKAEQIRIAELTLAKQGWGAWPACSRKLGLR